MSTPSTSREIAQAIAAQHAALLIGEPLTHQQVVQASDVALPTEIAGVLQGCRMLGFLEHDAQCVARAWQAQTKRTDHFSVTDWPCAPEDFGISFNAKANAFPPCPHALGLYAVMPDAQWVERMARMGIPTVQLRFKSNNAQAIRQQVRAAVQAVQGTETKLFINDHWQLAIDEGAYGVHLGQEDMDEASIEKIHAANLRLGLSTHGYAEMLRAHAWGPSYLALGAVFPTTLKRMQTAPQGTGRLFVYAKLMQHMPLVAIGGIDAERIPTVMQSGVGSIAVVRALTEARNPERAAQAMQALIEESSKNMC
jgi:thiamine-phosphate pyrophosphorylase